MQRSVRRLALAAVVISLLGCAAQETLVAPSREVPSAYRNQAAGPQLPRPARAWWRELGSSELDALEERALASNKDLQVAIARVAQAQAQAVIAGAARVPTVDVAARRETQAPADGLGTAATRADWHSQTNYQVGLRANYEIDLWGRYGYAADSALKLALASEFQRETVALTLTSDVAASYLEFLSLQDRMRVTERSLENRRNSLGAFVRRMEKGDATALEVAQQKVAVSTAEANLASLGQRRERAFNRLALLVGAAPAELEIGAQGLASLTLPAVAPGIPGELVCYRPDVRRAEAQLAAAALDVKAARASLLPSISLTGELGYGSHAFATLFSPASLLVSLTGSAAQTVFDAGRRDAQVDLARAKQLEVAHQYTATLLTALREVEDALATLRLTQAQHAALIDAVTAARSAYEASLKFYRIGMLDYFVVLDAEQKLVSSEEATESALHDRMRAAVDLYRALGGGTSMRPGETCPL